MAELEESKKAAAAQPDSPGKTPSTGTPADTQPNTPAPGLQNRPKTPRSPKTSSVVADINFLSVVDDSAAKTDDGEKEPKKEGEPEKNGKEPPAKANNEVRTHSGTTSFQIWWR